MGVAKAGSLKLVFRAKKRRRQFFFLRILFYTLKRYQNYKNPAGGIDTLIEVQYKLDRNGSKHDFIDSLWKNAFKK